MIYILAAAVVVTVAFLGRLDVVRLLPTYKKDPGFTDKDRRFRAQNLSK